MHTLYGAKVSPRKEDLKSDHLVWFRPIDFETLKWKNLHWRRLLPDNRMIKAPSPWNNSEGYLEMSSCVSASGAREVSGRWLEWPSQDRKILLIGICIDVFILPTPLNDLACPAVVYLSLPGLFPTPGFHKYGNLSLRRRLEGGVRDVNWLACFPSSCWVLVRHSCWRIFLMLVRNNYSINNYFLLYRSRSLRLPLGTKKSLLLISRFHFDYFALKYYVLMLITLPIVLKRSGESF